MEQATKNYGQTEALTRSEKKIWTAPTVNTLNMNRARSGGLGTVDHLSVTSSTP